jgi:hypothetical protein
VALFPDKITSISGSEVLIPACNAAAGAGNGVELWKIPVTAAGVAASPVMLEIEPGPGSSHPTWMVQNGEKFILPPMTVRVVSNCGGVTAHQLEPNV